MTRVLTLFVLAALALAPAVQARTIKLNWVDRVTSDFGYQPMTFKVASVTITARAWSVRGSVTNRSKRAVRIARPAPGYPQQYAFGLGWASACPPPNTACRLDTRRWTYAKPALPSRLRPGQRWEGVFGGPGVVPRGTLVNVTFGRFVPAGETQGFNWITQRAFKL